MVDSFFRYSICIKPYLSIKQTGCNVIPVHSRNLIDLVFNNHKHSLWLTLGVHWGSNIAYQFFTNIVSVKTFNETGLENYILAGCYILGFIIVYLLFKLGFFKTSDQLISDENN